MAEKLGPQGKTSTSEKAASVYRDFNAVGAVALFGVGMVLPPIAPAMNILAGINVLQSAGGEWVRRIAKRRRTKAS